MQRKPKEAGRGRRSSDKSAAQITRLRVMNWRNFKNVDLKLGRRMFFVGPNASGKSNLLDALRFLHDIAAPTGSLLHAAEERGGLSHIRSLHAGFVSRVEIEVGVRISEDSSEWRYLLALAGSPAKKQPMRIDNESVWHGDDLVLQRPGPGERGNDLLLSQTHLEQASQTLEFRPLVDGLASIEVAHVVPQVARTPGRSEELSRREAPGSDFIDQIAKLSEQRKRHALGRIEKLLRIAVPRFSNLDIERDPLGRPHLKAQYAHWRNKGGWQTERDFSDGTLRLIGLLWAIEQGRAPLILEEPELSLHRDVIRQLAQIFASATNRRGRQVLVSSHAEELIDDPGIDPSELVVLTPTEDETTARLGSTVPELVRAAEVGLTLAPIVTALTRPTEIAKLPTAFSGAARV